MTGQQAAGFKRVAGVAGVPTGNFIICKTRRNFGDNLVSDMRSLLHGRDKLPDGVRRQVLTADIAKAAILGYRFCPWHR